MPLGELEEALDAFANAGEPFLLSEVLARAGKKGHILHTAEALWPMFTALDLVAEQVPGDIRLAKRPSSPHRTLTLDERRRLDAFFRKPELPPGIEASIQEYVHAKTGKAWNDPSVLQKIRRAIVSQKDEYWREGEKKRVMYQKGYDVLGYLAYQAPVYFIQAMHLLYDLALAGCLKQHMRVLDLGCGPGVVPLGISGFLEKIGGCSAEIYSVEKSEEFIEAFRFLADHVPTPRRSVALHPPLNADLVTVPLSCLPPSLDLIVLQNVLNEMSGHSPRDKGRLVCRFAEALSPEGSILLVEPADMVNSMDLRVVVHHATGSGLFLHAPCKFLWNAQCTPDRCWSFVEKPPIRATGLMEALASGEEGYRYRNTDIKYSFALLRKVPPHSVPGLPLSPRNYARLSALHRHLNRRINVAGVVMSGNLGDHKTYVIKICDGTTKKPVYAILPSYHLSPENSALLSIPYGSIAEFTSVLARFNEKHRAYNLLLSRESRVREFPAQNRAADWKLTGPREKKNKMKK